MPRTRLPRLRRLLLELIAPAPLDTFPVGLTEQEWTAIDAMAEQHRLQPLLHYRRGEDGRIPALYRDGWAEARRTAALHSLAFRAELLAMTHRLTDAGIATVVMKGGALAWSVWPEPSLRPMRDLDLLLRDPAQADAAWGVLRASGYTLGKPFQGNADGKEMAELVSPVGVAVELHRHAWAASSEAQRIMPAGYEGMAARAAPAADGVLVPQAQDMLAHLVVHAAYSHWFDCGPLVLGDVAYLLEHETFDWPQVRNRARREGWEKGLDLVLAIVARYWGPVPTQFAAPPELVDAAPDLMLQDLDHRRASLLAAEWHSRGGAIGRVAAHAGNPGEMIRKAVTRMGEWTDAEVRQTARSQISLRDWLAGDA